MSGIPVVYFEYWPVLLGILAAVGFALVTILLAAVLTARRPNPVKQEPYECGIPILGPARIQVSARFYLFALLFLLFDIETIFILAWAVVFRDPALQVLSLIEMVVFIGILMVGYVFAWRRGALKWN